MRNARSRRSGKESPPDSCHLDRHGPSALSQADRFHLIPLGLLHFYVKTDFHVQSLPPARRIGKKRIRPEQGKQKSGEQKI
jgi:hypothetical protein